jgi:hypothetical protein
MVFENFVEIYFVFVSQTKNKKFERFGHLYPVVLQKKFAIDKFVFV